jgi:TonB family protein
MRAAVRCIQPAPCIPLSIESDAMRTRVLLLTAAALLAALPADAQRNRTPPCRTLARNAPLSARERADSAANVLRRVIADSLRADVAAAARQAGIGQPAGLVVVVIPDRGGPEVHRHESNVEEETIRQALARRATLTGSLPRGDNTLYFRLDPLLDAASAGSMTVEECQPQVLNVDRFTREVLAIGRREQPGPGVLMSPTNVLLRMLVSREGEVAYVTLERRSGRPAVNRMIMDAARTLRFEPATLNGTPRDVWVEQPIELDMRGDAPPARRP